MELEMRFIAGEFVAAPADTLEMNVRLILVEMRLQIVHCLHRQTIEPWLQSHAVRLFAARVESARDDLVHNFFDADGIGPQLSRAFTKKQLALSKQTQAAEIDVYVRTDIVCGRGQRRNRGESV